MSILLSLFIIFKIIPCAKASIEHCQEYSQNGAFSNHCVECEGGYYKNGSGEKCLPCSPGCVNCSDGNTCKSCKGGLSLRGGECHCKYHGQVLVDEECVDCSPECKNCSGTPTNCTSCSSSSYILIQNMSSVPVSSTCRCKTCPLNCKSCSDCNTCTECLNVELKLANDLKSCVCTKPSTYYDPVEKRCRPCSENCKACDGMNKCTTCENPKQLYLASGECICQKTGHYYDKNSEKCFPCDSKCATCKDYPDFCVTCNEGRTKGGFAKNGKCYCDDEKVLTEEGNCVCPEGYFNSYSGGCKNSCIKAIINDKFRDEILIINKKTSIGRDKGLTRNQKLDVMIDDFNCDQKLVHHKHPRFIEYTFIDAKSGEDLGIGKVGEIDDIFVPLEKETLKKLPVGKEIILKIKMRVSFQVFRGEEKGQIFQTEIFDQITFKVAPSPIEVVLRGVNTVYGKDDHISIDASETFDPDLEGLHYYLPFIFSWECPTEVPTLDCRNRALSGSHPYYISLYSNSMLSNGLKFGKYYPFKAIVSGKNKKKVEQFWVQMIDLEDIPKIEIIEQARGTDKIFLSVKITYSTKTQILFDSLFWELHTKNGSRIPLTTSSNSTQELIISKSDLSSQNVDRVYATTSAYNKTTKEKMPPQESQIHAFWPFKFSPPQIEGFLEPSLKIVTISESLFYSVIDIEIDNCESVIDGNTALTYSLHTSTNLILKESSYSRLLKKAVIPQSSQVIFAQICNIHTQDCLMTQQKISKSALVMSVKTGIEKIAEELLQGDLYYEADIDTKVNALRIAMGAFRENLEMVREYLQFFIFCDNLNFCIIKEIAVLFEDKNIAVKSLIRMLEDFSLLIEFMFSEDFIEEYWDQMIQEKSLENLMHYIKIISNSEAIGLIMQDIDSPYLQVSNSFHRIYERLYNGSYSFASDLPIAADMAKFSFEGLTKMERLISSTDLTYSSKIFGDIEKSSVMTVMEVAYQALIPAAHDDDCEFCVSVQNKIKQEGTGYHYGFSAIIKQTKIDDIAPKLHVFVRFIKNIFKDTNFPKFAKNYEGQDIGKLHYLVSTETFINSMQEKLYLYNFTLNIPLTELGVSQSNLEMKKMECIMYASSEGLNSYTDALVLNANGKNTHLISNNYFDQQYCQSETNQTHLNCNCNRDGLIAIVESEMNVTALKIFFFTIFLFSLLTFYMCGMICISVQPKQSTLATLQPLIGYKMTSTSSLFLILFKSIHPFTICSNSLATSSKKALSLFTLSILTCFLIFTLLVDLWSEDHGEDPEGVFRGFESKLELMPFMVAFSGVLVGMFEVLKNLFVRVPREDGVAELKEVPLEFIQKDEVKGEVEPEVKDESKISPADFEENERKEEKEPEVALESARVQTNPASTNRDDISTGRQFSGIINPELKGTRNKEVIDVSKSLDNSKSPGESQDLEIVLEAETFETSTKYSKIRLSLGTILIAIILGLFLYICIFKLNSLHINALLRSIGYSVLSLIFTLLVTYPLYLLILSFLLANQCDRLTFCINLIVSKEITIIMIKILKVQNCVKKEKQRLEKKQIADDTNLGDVSSRNPAISSRLYEGGPLEVSGNLEGKDEQVAQSNREHYLNQNDAPSKFSRRKRHRNPRQSNNMVGSGERSDD